MVQETRTPETPLPCEGWTPLLCHPDVVLHVALLQDSVTGVTFQLWMLALHLCAVSKDSSEFGLQPSQCLQNFPVKKRDNSSGYFRNLLIYFFSSDSYGFYTTNCILVCCWFFLPPSLSLQKIPQHQKPSLSSPGRVLSLILARYVYKHYAYTILYWGIGTLDLMRRSCVPCDWHLSPSIELEED